MIRVYVVVGSSKNPLTCNCWRCHARAVSLSLSRAFTVRGGLLFGRLPAETILRIRLFRAAGAAAMERGGCGKILTTAVLPERDRAIFLRQVRRFEGVFVLESPVHQSRVAAHSFQVGAEGHQQPYQQQRGRGSATRQPFGKHFRKVFRQGERVEKCKRFNAELSVLLSFAQGLTSVNCERIVVGLVGI